MAKATETIAIQARSAACGDTAGNGIAEMKPQAMAAPVHARAT